MKETILNFGSKLLVITGFALAVWGITKFFEPKTWDLFYYRGGDLMGMVDRTVGYKTLEECKEQGEYRKWAYGDPEGMYECGRGCKKPNEYGIRICKETVD